MKALPGANGDKARGNVAPFKIGDLLVERQVGKAVRIVGEEPWLTVEVFA